MSRAPGDRSPRRRSRPFAVLAAVLGIILLLGLLGFTYMVSTRGWERARNEVFNSTRSAVYAMKETSEDAAITAKVKTALSLSERVPARDVDVDTTNGQVTLRGLVPSQEVRSIAEVIARDTAGVGVVHNQLTVHPQGLAQAESDAMRNRVADLEMRYMVTNAIAKNEQIRDRNIQVEAAGNTVTLSGAVESSDDKYLAEQLAWGVDGVESVQNQIIVTQPGPTETNDDVLAREVEFALFSTKALDMEGIQVQADDGTVMLSGSVTSFAEKLLAARVAADVAGVKRVINNVQVRKDV